MASDYKRYKVTYVDYVTASSEEEAIDKASSEIGANSTFLEYAEVREADDES